MRKLIAVLLLTMGLLLLVGCETVPNNMKREVIADADLLATSHQAAEALITKAGEIAAQPPGDCGKFCQY